MAHVTITDEQVDANSPINELLTKDRIKNNDDDHETRVLALEADATSWTSQLGTLITDTDMGTFTGDILTDDTTARALLQELETTHEEGGKMVAIYQDAEVSEGSNVYKNVFTAGISNILTRSGDIMIDLEFEAKKDATISEVMDMRLYVDGTLWQIFADQSLTTSYVRYRFVKTFTGETKGSDALDLEFRRDGSGANVYLQKVKFMAWGL